MRAGSRALQVSGAISVSFAPTEEEAVDSARSQLPGVIGFDVALAAGTGILAVARILAEHGDIPAVLISGNDPIVQATRPPCLVIEMPLGPDQLAAAFRRLVHH